MLQRENLLKESEKQAEFIYGVTDRVIQLEQDIIAGKFEKILNATEEETKINKVESCIKWQSLEYTKQTEEQRYVERMTHSIPFPEVKEIAYFKKHIWGL